MSSVHDLLPGKLYSAHAPCAGIGVSGVAQDTDAPLLFPLHDLRQEAHCATGCHVARRADRYTIKLSYGRLGGPLLGADCPRAKRTFGRYHREAPSGSCRRVLARALAFERAWPAVLEY